MAVVIQISTNTFNWDLVKKKDVYGKAGVQEYWVVDPKTSLAIGFRLIKKKYEEFNRAKGQINWHLLEHVFKF